MTTALPPRPFTNDLEYLDAEFTCLAARSARQALQRDRVHALDPSMEDAPGQLAKATRHEKTLRRDLDARLAVHRADKGRTTLGLDHLCHHHGLDAGDRQVLLAAAVPAVSQPFAERLLSGTDFYGMMSVAGLIDLVFEPVTAADWITARARFRPSGALRRAGLLIVGAPRGVPAGGTLPALDVRVDVATLAFLFGDNGFVSEFEGVAS